MSLGEKMIKLGAVVLNYINYYDTIDCVESLLNQKAIEMELVIVDNASPNNAFEILTEKYKNNSRISILKAPTNLGFAKGNNLGIRYAIEKLGCSDIFILNSDTILLEDNVCVEMMNEYRKGVGLINPICVDVNQKIQKPYGRFTENLFFETLRVFFNIFSGTFQNIFKIRFGLTKHIKAYEGEQLTNNGYVIQGSAYILTADFFRYYKQIYPKTFLYGEELNLAWYLKKIGLKTTIALNTKILHKEGGSTEYIGIKKVMRKFRYQLDSFFKSIPVYCYSYSTISKKYG